MKLTEVCDFQGGSQPPKNEWSFEKQDGYIRMLQIRDFTQSDSVTPEYIKISNSTKICDADDILIARYGASIGKILTGLAGAYNVAIMRTIPDTSKLKKRYLYYYLKSDYFQNAILNVGSRAAQAGFNKEDLAKLDIRCPELSRQEEIINILYRIESIIDKRRKELSALDTLIKARFVEMFGDLYSNSFSWKKLKIKQAVTLEPQNGLYKPQSEYVSDGTGTPILRIDGFYNGKVTDFTTLKRLNCTDDERQRYLLCENDIVINRVNSIEYLGKCAHITGLFEETVYESNMMRMRFDLERFNPTYICQLLCNNYIYRQIVSHAKKAVNQASINQKDVLDFDIYEPPLSLQNEFADFVQQIDKLRVVIQKSLDEAQYLFDSLMQEYFG